MSDARTPSGQSPGNQRIAQRFRIESVVADGGMGTIYRAVDEQTGRLVALKLLRASSTRDATKRFLREGGLLATVQHPGIVGYVAHGIEESGLPYLAMEWIEGEDLSRRLARGPLSLKESMGLLRTVAEALAVLHQHGIVHRDLKPANLFLRQGSLQGVTILDFGLARFDSRENSFTEAGMVLGTPEYMAPEQARGEQALTAAVDVFALGCIFHECLTGRSPFRAERLSVILAKILFETPPSPRLHNPALPLALDRFFSRLLAKDPTVRLPDAVALVREMDALPQEPADQESDSDSVPGGVSASEQRVIGLLMVSLLPPFAREESGALPPSASVADPRSVLYKRLTALGAHVERLANGLIVAQLEAHNGVASDLAVRAAHHALDIRVEAPDAFIALALGCAHWHPGRIEGEILNRIERLLQLHGPEDGAREILLDSVTASLLDVSFQIEPGPGGSHRLVGRRGLDVSRPLLGRPTPCTGRDFELSSLEMELRHCMDDSVSRAVVVLGPPGIGKTRLRLEFLQRTREQLSGLGVSTDFLVARADEQTIRSPYGLIASALQHLCGVTGSEPEGVRHSLLVERLGKHLRTDESALDRTLEILVELSESPGRSEILSLLLPREDAKAAQEEVEEAFCRLLLAEADDHPVILAIDDLQWADSQSVKLLGAALRNLSESPLLLLAWGRPEVRERFPYLWEGNRQEMQLRGLTKKASEQLIRDSLGPQAPSQIVERIVDQSAGNTLFLEELVRAYAAGEGANHADTVLAMLQARMGRLPPEARRVLRAASLFGMRFRMSGVSHLLGAIYSDAVLAQHLSFLVANELCDEKVDRRLPGGKEYSFRHALVREAAYGLLTEEDRRFGHRLAGQFLSQAGERNPQILLEHFIRGEDHKNAAEQLLRVGDQAMRLCSRQEARQHYLHAVERAARLGEGPSQRALKAESLLCLVRSALDVDPAADNLERLRLAEAALQPRSGEPPEQDSGDEQRAERIARLHYLRGRIFLYSGDGEAALREYELVLPVAQRLGRAELIAHPACLRAYTFFNQGNYKAAAPPLRQAMEAFDKIKEPMESLRMQSGYAVCLMAIGEMTAAEAEFAAVEQYARSSQQPAALAVWQINRLAKFLWSGDRAAVLREGPEFLEAVIRLGDWILVYFGALAVGEAATQAGDFTTARAFFGRAAALVQKAGEQFLMSDQLELVQLELVLAEGRYAEALAQAGDFCAKARAAGLIFSLARAERCCAQALAALQPDRLVEIEQHIRHSLDACERGGLVLERARTQLSWALILKRHGAIARAEELHDTALSHLRTSWCRSALDEVSRSWAAAAEAECTV